MSIDVNPHEDFHVLLNGNVMALPLERLDDWYQSDIIEDETLIWQQGLGEWMRLDVVLAQLAEGVPEHAPAPPLSEDIFFVLVAEGEVKQMSLDLLADSFRLEVIDGETLVWQAGYTEWIPLSLLIGDEPREHVSFAPSYAASVPPIAFSIPAEAPKASPWFQRSLLAAAVVMSVLVAYRNGAGLALAQGVGEEARFTALEADAKAPGPETPHGLDTWLARVEESYHLADLSETEPVKKEAETGAEVTKPDAAKPDAAKPKTKLETKPREQHTAGSEAKPESPVDTGQTVSAFTAKLNNEPVPVKARVSARKNRTSSGGLPSSGNPNDPMNGAL